MISSATRSSSSNWPPRSSTAPSAWLSWTASSTSASGDEHYYAQELFEQEELRGYLKNHARRPRSRSTNRWSMTPTPKRTFAEQLGEERGVQGLRQASGLVHESPRRSAPTTPTGPCWSRRMEENGSTSWSKPRAASSPTTCATRRRRRSNAERPTSAPLRSVRRPPNISLQKTRMIF